MSQTRRRQVAVMTFLFSCVMIAAGQTGDYHRPGDMVCSDCHVMHYRAEGTGPYPSLLKQTVTDLCLSCHDGQTGGGNIAPDVLGLAGAGQPTYRAAGAFQESVGQSTPNGHDLLAPGTPPGGTTTLTLTCLSCHDPHGNGNYRNLVSNPGGQSGRAVTAVTQDTLTPTASQYAVGNVHYTAAGDGGLSAWCAGCHGDFHGAGGAPTLGGSTLGDTNQAAVSPWLRHPTFGLTMSQAYSNQHIDSRRWFSALASRAPVVSPSRIIPGSPAGSDNEVFCGSCHKTHGSTHRYGLLWDDADTATPEDGTAQMDTCQQCHYK